MKIFIAGATGTLGIPLVHELVANGHEVIGMTRKEAKRSMLEKLGAGAAIADALDEGAINRAVRDARPDMVVDLLTAIPPQGPMRAADMSPTNRLRIESTEYLLRASIASRTKRIVAESMILTYGYGNHGEVRIREYDPLQPAEPLAGTEDTVDALRTLESKLIGASRNKEIESVALRFGILYGPGVPATESNLQGLRMRKIPVVRSGSGTISWVHVQDAVSAIVAALERGRCGEVYNIVDDEPTSYRDFLLYAAKVTGVPRPRALPLWFFRLTAPYAATFLSTRLNVSNEKAKNELGWNLRFPNYKEGLKDLAASLEREKKAV
jgi:nucleoside-diphosphate-sugar epimerase